MTYREVCIAVIKEVPNSTCAEITRMVKDVKGDRRNLKTINATVSSILKKLLKERILTIGLGLGPREGRKYKIRTNV